MDTTVLNTLIRFFDIIIIYTNEHTKHITQKGVNPMAITFLQLAKKILEDERRPLSVPEIWQIAVDKGKEKLLESSGKTPWASLGAMLYVDVRDNPNSDFLSIGARPKRFILKSQKEIIDINSTDVLNLTEIKSQKPAYLEKDLHPLMVYYGSYYLKAYLKTIHHSKSNKKEFGEWVHPDIVGCYYPFSDWDEDVVDVSNLLSSSAIKLFSFELKRELNFGNLRESFFQAVSNSSWANEGYLVAAEIEEDDEFISELTRLTTAFGIGVIKLNIEDPDSCETLLPAQTKDRIDWDTVNKMANMNSDIKEFLKRIRIDTTSKEAHKDKYDPVFEKEYLVKSFAKK